MSKSSIIKTGGCPLKNPLAGEILLEEFMKPLALSQIALARAIEVPLGALDDIIQGYSALTAETDLRLANYFGMSEGFFLGLQAAHDMMELCRKNPESTQS